MIKKYGKTELEEKVGESIKSREIVTAILDHGVSQFQIAKIIKFLSLELENIEVLKNIDDALKPLLTDKKENNSSIIVTE